jgi:hypothetical protein
VRYGIYFKFVHDGGANSYRTRAFAGGDAPESTIGQGLHDEFLAVVGHVNEGRVEVHQRLNAGINLTDVLAFQRRQDLEGEEGVLGGIYVFNYFHGL